MGGEAPLSQKGLSLSQSRLIPVSSFYLPPLVDTGMPTDRPARIMVVDDEPAVRAPLARALGIPLTLLGFPQRPARVLHWKRRLE